MVCISADLGAWGWGTFQSQVLCLIILHVVGHALYDAIDSIKTHIAICISNHPHLCLDVDLKPVFTLRYADCVGLWQDVDILDEAPKDVIERVVKAITNLELLFKVITAHELRSCKLVDTFVNLYGQVLLRRPKVPVFVPIELIYDLLSFRNVSHIDAVILIQCDPCAP